MPIEEFINATFGISKSSIVSGVTIAEEGQESSKQESAQEENQQTSQQGGEQSKEKNARIKFYNEIYYFKDGEYINKLEKEEEILGFYFTDKTANNGEFKVSNVTGNLLEEATVGVAFTDKKATTSVKFKNGKPTFTFNIKIKNIQITEILNKDKPTVHLYNQKDEELLNLIKDKTSEEIEKYVLMAFKKAQTDGVDIFDIGEKMYQTKTKEWKEFYDKYGDNYLKNVNVKVNVEISNIN